MYKLFKSNFKKTNDCMILAVPLVFFMLIIEIYFYFARSSVDSLPKLVLTAVTMLFIVSGCLASWFYMAKKTLSLADKVFVFEKDRVKAFGDLILSLPKGIGRLFIPFIGYVLIVSVIYAIIFCGSAYLVHNYIAPLSPELLDINAVFVTTEELYNEIMLLPENQIIALICWLFLVFILISIVSFVLFLWVPEIVYSKRNSVISLVRSIQKIIITFPRTIFLYIIVQILVIVTCIVNTLLMINPFLCFIVLLISYYLFLYVVVLVFSYYEQTFISED